MPTLERMVELAQLPGSETVFTMKLPDGGQASINLNDIWSELLGAVRAMETLVEARNITDRGGLGGLGPPPQA
jgi:hypothetical protein